MFKNILSAACVLAIASALTLQNNQNTDVQYYAETSNSGPTKAQLQAQADAIAKATGGKQENVGGTSWQAMINEKKRASSEDIEKKQPKKKDYNSSPDDQPNSPPENMTSHSQALQGGIEQDVRI